MLVGLTHTQYSADSYNDPQAVGRAEQILAQLDLENQFIMGWGGLNPEPSPGVFQWKSLDQRVALMRKRNHPMVLTLCCAPTWMVGGPAGQTDWSVMNEAPLPRYYQDFAELTKVIALRYPDVGYYQVWSELRGFRNKAQNRWDYEGYTTLYNYVYSALKSVNPNLQVGGPYVVMDSWRSPGAGGHPSAIRGAWGTLDQRPLDVLTYWLRHKLGADFVTVDGNLAPRDGGPPLEPSAAIGKLVAVNQWLSNSTRLPLWWSEVHVGPANWYPNAAVRGSATSMALSTLASSGTSVALLWCGERCTAMDGTPGLWTPTNTADGGFPTPVMTAVTRLLDGWRGV
jgi:hypothetical protein